LNKPSGRGREFFGCLGILALVAAVAAVLILVLGRMAWVKGWGKDSDVGRPDGPAVDAGPVLVGEDVSGEMKSLFEMVRSSSHVTGNKMYSAIAGQTRFVYDANEDEINAYSTIRHAEEGDVPMVVLNAGLVRFAHVGALVLAAANNGRTNQFESFVHTLRNEWQGKLSVVNALEFLQADGLLTSIDEKICDEARSIEAGMILAVLSHEVGHLALGHLFRDGKSEDNLEIARNREREADSFASSVISASPFGTHMFEGFFLFHFAMACSERFNTDDRKMDHPSSCERLVNFVRQNRGRAEALGVTEHDVERLMAVRAAGGERGGGGDAARPRRGDAVTGGGL